MLTTGFKKRKIRRSSKRRHKARKGPYEVKKSAGDNKRYSPRFYFCKTAKKGNGVRVGNFHGERT